MSNWKQNKTSSPAYYRRLKGITDSWRSLMKAVDYFHRRALLAALSLQNFRWQ